MTPGTGTKPRKQLLRLHANRNRPLVPCEPRLSRRRGPIVLHEVVLLRQVASRKAVAGALRKVRVRPLSHRPDLEVVIYVCEQVVVRAHGLHGLAPVRAVQDDERTAELEIPTPEGEVLVGLHGGIPMQLPQLGHCLTVN